MDVIGVARGGLRRPGQPIVLEQQHEEVYIYIGFCEQVIYCFDRFYLVK